MIRQSVIDLFRNDGLAWAAALSFYTLLSLFPLTIGAIIAASYLTDPVWVAERIVNGIEEFVPSSQLDVAAMIAGAEVERRQMGLVALGVVLITGRRILGTLITAMNQMSDVDQLGDPIRRRVLVELGLVIGLAVLAGLAIVSRPALDAVERLVGVAEEQDPLIRALVLEATQTFLIFAAFVLTYYVLPNGQRSWRAVLIAATLTTVGFVLIRAAFTLLVGWLWDSLSTLYGPLATAAFLLIWIYWVAVVVLFGASLASHIKVMLIDGRTSEQAERTHVDHSDDMPALS